MIPSTKIKRPQYKISDYYQVRDLFLKGLTPLEIAHQINRECLLVEKLIYKLIKQKFIVPEIDLKTINTSFLNQFVPAPFTVKKIYGSGWCLVKDNIIIKSLSNYSYTAYMRVKYDSITTD